MFMKQFYLKLRLILMFSIFSVWSMYAQTTVTGTITDDAEEPLIGASILVRGTAVGAVTDFDGKFSLEAPEGATEIEISYTGYSSKILKLSDGTSNLKIILGDDINQLDEIVVTGLATTVKRKNLANSVARIDASELTGVTPQSTLDGALAGKFTGAEIKANSGAPGGGMSFKSRGTTSISGSSQPLIILDGVYIDNSSIPAGLNVVSAAASGGSTSNQDNPSNRLADINPYDIESVEILKGASTAAIYGSRASGGVIIITTKKGEAGKTKFNFSQSVGVVSQLNKLGVRDFTEATVLASDRFAGDIDLFRAAKSSGNIQNYEDELYGTGILSTTNFSARGGDQKTQFYIGGSYKNDEGIVEGTGYKKTSARFNINHQINDIFKFAITSNYINSSADRGFFNNDNSGNTMGVSFSSTPSWAQLLPNENGVYPANTYAPSNFLETANTITNNEGVNRFIGGGSVSANILQKTNSSLKAVFRGGIDFYNLKTTALFPNS
ncbi:MAG: TonB-dependent SusC/RagA subfamily outer membrane receptor, partial [Saprospiraceae bacterium]